MSETMIAEAPVSDDVTIVESDVDVLNVGDLPSDGEDASDLPSEPGGVSDLSAVGQEIERDDFTVACDEIAKAAERGFNSGTKDRLIAGERAYALVLKERDRRGERFKRADTIKAIEDMIFNRSRLQKSTIQVSKWIKTTHTAFLYFGVARVSLIPTDAVNRITWELLVSLEKMVERDANENYVVKHGCMDLFREIMDSHVKGDPKRLKGLALRERIGDLLDDLKKAEAARKRSEQTPQQIADQDRRDEDAKRRRARTARENAASALRDTLNEQGIRDASDRVSLLVEMGVVAKSDLQPNTDPARVDLDAFARLMSKEDGLALVKALVDSKRLDVLMTMHGRITQIISAVKAARMTEENAAIPMARAV